MIRASVDLRAPNNFMERNRIMQGPLVENSTYKFHDCVIFSKMDLRQGYMQLVLDPKSRSQRNIREPAYLKDCVHWAGDETLEEL